MNIFNIPKSLLEAINKVILNEHEMTRREVNMVDDKFRKEIAAHRVSANEISGHVFGNSDRIVVPFMHHEHPVKTAVESHLHSNGFTNTNYGEGTTTDSYGRQVAIGKALSRTNADKALVNGFAEHYKSYPREKQLESGNDLQVVISKHPHDVIGMSHGTNWGIRENEKHSGPVVPVQSCMKFGTFQHETHMPHELHAGTHVAWLTRKGDDEAKEPISRITLRPYSNKTDTPGRFYKSYTFESPANSMFVKNASHSLEDETVEDSIDNHIAMTVDPEYSDTIPHAEKFHHSITVKHPTEDSYITTMHFNKPMHIDNLNEFHDELSQEVGHYTPLRVNRDEAITVDAPKDVHKILVPGSKTYGEQSHSFKQTVKDWVNTHFKPHPDQTYRAAPSIYLDGDRAEVDGK